MLPLIPLLVLHFVVLCAGFFAPHPSDRQHRNLVFAPPARLHFFDAEGKFHLRPFVYALRAETDGSYQEDQSRKFPVRFFVTGEKYRIAGLWSFRIHLFGVDEPATIFLWGSDDYGRDQFSRFLFGAQISLLAGPLAACLALSLGTVVGGLSGFYGGFADDLLMAVTELFLSLPWLYLLLAVRALLPLDLDPRQAFLVIVSVLGLIGWARPARLVRGVVLSAKEREFVLAARGFGASDLYLLRRHVLPQTQGILLTQAALLVPRYILAEISMSFLGLGLNEPVASWGLLLAALQQYYAFVSHWWMWIPAVLIVPIFFGYYTLAAALGGLDAGPLKPQYSPLGGRKTAS
jgi:peptide/nickel transport system permease protein